MPTVPSVDDPLKGLPLYVCILEEALSILEDGNGQVATYL